jgi:hypothetical protein
MPEEGRAGSPRLGLRRTRYAAASVVLLVISFAVSLSSPALAARSIKEALLRGKPTLDLRYRYETVDQPDLFDEKATASTMRLRLGYKTDTWNGLYAYADLESNTSFRSESYDSTANDKIEYPVIADPQDTELNAAYLGYAWREAVNFQLGRQAITLDNQRFVGPDGWRQLQQTFDAYTVKATVFQELAVIYGRLNNANRVFGEHHPVEAPIDPSMGASADLDLAADILNVAFTLQAGTLTGYAYLLDLEDVPAASHRNLGLRYAGEYPLTANSTLIYAAEYASQSDYKDAADTVDAEYRLLELGLGIGGLRAKLGHELLGGDGTYAFQTPLATLHGFNGWADQFLVTPPEGLQDRYLSVEATFGQLKLQGIWHDFSADEGRADYGTEMDLLGVLTLRQIYSILVKYAKYDADEHALDTDKLWVQVQVKF